MKATNLARWNQLWLNVAPGFDASSAYQEVIALYSEPHRYYHSLEHISDCLGEFDATSHLAKNLLALELAIWLHDVVYDTHVWDNEERSAVFAQRMIEQAQGPASLAADVVALIMATKTHNPAAHPDAPLLVDLDLSILGQSDTRFDRYEAQIGQEYAWVPHKMFCTKRAEILEKFLARPRIFNTAPFFNQYEQPARANLQRSILKLKS